MRFYRHVLQEGDPRAEPGYTGGFTSQHFNASLPGELKEVKKRKVWASMPTCCSYNREPDKEQKILFKTFSL